MQFLMITMTQRVICTIKNIEVNNDISAMMMMRTMTNKTNDLQMKDELCWDGNGISV